MILLLILLSFISLTGCRNSNKATDDLNNHSLNNLRMIDYYQRATDGIGGCVIEYGGSIKNNSDKSVRINKISMNVIDNEDKILKIMDFNIKPNVLNPDQEVYISTSQTFEGVVGSSFKTISLNNIEYEMTENYSPKYENIEMNNLALTGIPVSEMTGNPLAGDFIEYKGTIDNLTEDTFVATYYSVIIRNEKEEIVLIINDMDSTTLLPNGLIEISGSFNISGIIMGMNQTEFFNSHNMAIQVLGQVRN